MKLLKTKKQNIIKYFVLVLFIILYFEGFSQNPIWPSVYGTPKGTFEEIQKDFNNYWDGRAYQKGKGYKQYKRWETYITPRIYPSGDLTLPSTNYHNFLEWQKNQPAGSRTMAANWTELGPMARPTGADSGVGRLNMVRFDPTNSNTMYVGAPDGGLWKSTNGGSSWTTNTDFLAVIGVSDLAIDPGNTQIMYLATGDIEGDRRSIGVLKSIDGGANWSTTGLTWTATDNYKISKLLMDPANSSILLAATDGGVFRTTDGGVNWTSPSTIVDFKDMEFKPGTGNSGTVYAAGKEFWKSTDNGVSWTKITAGLPSSNIGRIALGVSANDATYVYALIGKADDNGYLGLYRSTDSGANFTLRSSTPNVLGFDADGMDVGGQAFYDLAIAVSPSNAEEVTVGGINMWQSTDGGTNWSIISHWDPTETPPFVHADIHEINYLPGSSTTFFSCCDGGLYKTTDSGVNWTDISNNLSISQQNAVGISATSASHLVAGLQDIGTIYTTGSWAVVGGGDGEDCFIDRTTNNNIVITGTFGSHQLSTDGGSSFNNIVTGLPNGDGNALFFSPIRQDPTTAARFYAGGRANLYRSNNIGTSWTALGAPFGTDKIIEFAVAPSDNTVIYALKSDAFAISTDSGTSFTDRTTGLPVGSASLTNLTVSNTDKNKVWVTFSGYSAGDKVYKTTDGGQNWTNVSTGLPNLPVNAIVYHNGSTNEDVYIGMDIGVYRIDNTTSTWASYFTNLPNARVRNLRIFYPTSKIRAATYGRGAWESDLFAVLPVELVDFSGLNRGTTNELSWTTLSESDLDFYTIERSLNGQKFESIGSVSPESVNSHEEHNYIFRDLKPSIGINYYRLKIVDIDGDYEYSRVISLYLENGKDGINVYPNPANNIVELKGVNLENTTIQLMDALGRNISSQHLWENAQINVSYLPNGIYYIEISNSIGKKSVVKRFIKE